MVGATDLKSASFRARDSVEYDLWKQYFSFVTDQLYSKAFPPISALADSGDPYAMVHLGFLYLFGKGIQRNLEQAKYWLENAIKEKDQLDKTYCGLAH